MLTFEGHRGVEFCDGLTRRDFLRVGALSAGAVGLSLADLVQLQHAGADSAAGPLNCILLFLVGGPSHLDTFDPKPDAPDHIRGPFKPIRTNVPGIHLGEHFPRMAQRADRYAIIRSVYHQEAPVHETGHQLMQTGYLFRGGVEYPHYGTVLSRLRGAKHAGVPPWVVLPGPIGNTGISLSHGQSAGFLGRACEPFFLGQGAVDREPWAATSAQVPDDWPRAAGRSPLLAAVDRVERGLEVSGVLDTADPATGRALGTLLSGRAKRALDLSAERPAVRARYGETTFGQACLLARRLVEAGVRLVTVNMFDTVFNAVTWDCHANGGDLHATLDDYRTTLCPMLDQAYAALLDDLAERGLLASTVVLCLGEFGRTPRINNRGGRDHWPNCWSVLLAGGPIRGGQVIGASDPHGAEPSARPVHPSELAATIYYSLGLDPATRLPGPDGQLVPLAAAEPVWEVF
jgi:uncharacterized protein (DUF1501 family)